MGLKKLHNAAIKIFGNVMCMKIIDVSDYALPAILIKVKYHITAYSASVIDAALLNKKSGIWAYEEHMNTWFRSYIENGLVDILSYQSDEIFNTINKNIFE
jgi:hypothetical protein